MAVGSHTSEKQAATDICAGDDAITRDQRRHREAPASINIMDKFGGRHDLCVSPKGPTAVIKIKLWHDIREIDIGLPIGIDRTNITPIGVAFAAGANA